MSDAAAGESLRPEYLTTRAEASPARPLWFGWSGHWPALVAVLAVASGWGISGNIVTTPATLMAVGSTIPAYLVADRWGCWRWLSSLATVPMLLGPALTLDLGWRGALSVAVAACAVAVLAWHASARPLAWAVGGALLVAAGPVAWLAEPTDHELLAGHPVRVTGLALCLLVAVAAVAGLGRSRVLPMRLACALLVLVPGSLLAAPAYAALLALTCWPIAAAIGVTALLRGGRAAGARRPQLDSTDEEVLAAFAASHGDRTLAPVTVVIAAYNEAAGLPGVLATLPTEMCGLPVDVLVVDDGSTDCTAGALAGSSAYVASCPVNRGQGAALRLGYRLARRHGARYLITTDADGQYDVADLPGVLAPILAGNADFVSGSRVLGHQHTFDRVRRAGVHAFAWLATFLTGQRLTDTSFGLRAMRAEVTAAVTLNQPQYQSSELLLGVISHGFRVLEVPGTMHLRSAGTTRKGRNLTYGSSYAKAMTTTWWREGAPRPVTEFAEALRTQPGTTATPITDWPNGGVTRRSTVRVTGTTKRS